MIMSNMDITENRVPQDGRFRIKTEDKEIDFRVSALPLNYGNKIIAAVLTLATTAIGTAVLPYFSRMVADLEWKDIRSTIKFYLGIIFVFGIPAAFVASHGHFQGIGGRVAGVGHLPHNALELWTDAERRWAGAIL